MVTNSTKSDEYPTVIGADAVFKGELSFEGSVRIDGRFEGGIKTPGTVFVSQNGKVKAEISAGSITVDGNIDGNVITEGRVQLNASSKLKGDVMCGKLMVAEGATWSGRCEVGPSAGKGATQNPALRQVADAAAGKK